MQEHVDYITPGIKLYATGTKRPAPEDLEKRSQKTASSVEGEALEKRWFGSGRGHRPHPPPKKPMPPGLPSNITDGGLAICDVVATPQCIARLYNITQGHKAHPGNQLGIFEDLGDVYSQEDLNLFFESLAPYIPQGTHPVLDLIDGAVAPTNVANAGAESDLDFQISYPIIWPQNSVLFQTDDPVYEANYTYDGFLNNFLDAIVSINVQMSQARWLTVDRMARIARTVPLARRATALLTLRTPTQHLAATREISSAACTSLPTSSPSRMAGM